MNYIYIVIFALSINLHFQGICQGQTTYSETGTASYYASEFHGKKTASGEKYNMNDFTAAHNSLPFNTYVKVTNLQNQQSVIVRINDRGPHTKNRLIDLSKAAAKKIGLIQCGVAKVKVESVTPPEKSENKEEEIKSTEGPTVSSLAHLKKGKTYTPTLEEIKLEGYVIQLSSFSDSDKLMREVERIKTDIKNIYIEVSEVKSIKTYRILNGSFDSKIKAQEELNKLKKMGYTGFVKKTN